uniref:Uncharacterized protein n=1 Tax=Glossina austeni TaxID=7395 RepID=A0A1A9UTA4_GLOAU
MLAARNCHLAFTIVSIKKKSQPEFLKANLWVGSQQCIHFSSSGLKKGLSVAVGIAVFIILLNCHTLNSLIERLDMDANVRTVIAEIRTPSKNALEVLVQHSPHHIDMVHIVLDPDYMNIAFYLYEFDNHLLYQVVAFRNIFNFIKSPLKSLKQTMEPVTSGIRYISMPSQNVESHILPFPAMKRVVLHASVLPTGLPEVTANINTPA